MRVLFAGTPDFAVPPLQELAKEHEIIGVYTQPDRRAGRGKKVTPPPVKVAAQPILQTQNIGAEIYQPNSLSEEHEVIASLQPDVMVVVAYGMLLPQAILDIPKLGCINIHASLLPRWRGAAPIHRAIEAGDRESGVAIMKMEIGLDTGPVFEMLKTSIEADDTTASLHDKLSVLGAQGISNTLQQLTKDPTIEPHPQDHAFATYAKKLSKQEAKICWEDSAKLIDQKIRAFIPFPVSQCLYLEKRIRVWRASVLKSDNAARSTAGQVLDISAEGAIIQCGEGLLRLETLQRDGGKPMDWKEFNNGFAINVGDKLT